jgi:pilus assembly protein FimV
MVSDPRNIVDVQAPDSFKMAYLRERFPEIAQGSLRLDKPDSLIQAARLYYQEDNNSAKAAELLEYAIGEYPNEVRPWLAVFEIYRLENRKADFANLALRFKAKFEHGGYWPKVQAIGRQIDAENSLYVAQEFDTEHSNVDDAAISAEAENWLNAPLDFTQDLLGNELRNALMSDDAPITKSPAKTAAPYELTLSPEGKKPVS